MLISLLAHHLFFFTFEALYELFKYKFLVQVLNVIPIKGGAPPKFAQRTQLITDNYQVVWQVFICYWIEYLKMNQQFSSIFVSYSLKKWDLWCWTCYFHWYEPHSSQFRMFMWVLSGSYFLGCCICATHSAFQFCQVQILWIYFLLYRVLQT